MKSSHHSKGFPAKKYLRIAIGEFKHEVNTFSPVPTTIDTYRETHLLENEAVIKSLVHTNTEIWGFYQQSRDYYWEILPLVAANAFSGGPLTSNTYHFLRNKFIQHLENVLPIEGIFLALHGATIADVDGGEDATGLFLKDIRSILGNEVPMIITLDLHANITQQIVNNVNAIIGYRTWPHIDLAERGQDAARLMHTTLKGGANPTVAFTKLPMILQMENGQTTSGPMAKLISRIMEWDTVGKYIFGSVFIVQPWIDIPDVGCSVTVVTDGDKEGAQSLANSLANDMWNIRHEFDVSLVPIDKAIDIAIRAKGRPVVLADSADSTGSGAPGDSTAILKRLLEREIDCKVLLPIVDKEVVEIAHSLGINKVVNTDIGGKIDQIYNQPINIEAVVEWLGEPTFTFKGPVFTGQESDMGRVAVLGVRDMHIVVSERPVWTVDPEMYRSVGLEPTQAQIVLVKSPNQFRAGYEPIAHQIIVVDAPGRASSNLKALPFRRIQRPFYPFDENWAGAPGINSETRYPM